MEKATCSSCQKPKATLSCGICDGALCKNCAQFIDEGQFSFMAKTPENLSHSVFCQGCYAQSVEPELEKYNELMEKAKAIDIFDKKQIKETRFLKRLETPLQVLDCEDRDETILRLAFLAAEAGFNSVIDVVLTSQKVSQNKYQTTKWSATGIPVHLNPDRLVKDRSTWENPN